MTAYRWGARGVACAGAAMALMLPLAMTSNAMASAGCKVSDKNTHKSYSSLGAAVSAAGSGDTLVLSGNCASTSETRIIGLTLTIVGKGKNPTISLASGSTGTVLGVSPSANVTIDGLTITGGNGTQVGGGLDNSGTAVLNNTTIRGNIATVDGGGIMNEEGGTLTLNGSAVTNNSAAAPGSQAFGGGIFDSSAATVTLNDSSVSGNTAGPADAQFGFGAGIYVMGTLPGTAGGSVTLNGTSTVAGNTASGTTGADGGGVFVDSGASLTLNDTTSVTGNQATSSSTTTDAADGGGVFLISNGNGNGTLTMAPTASVTGNMPDDIS